MQKKPRLFWTFSTVCHENVNSHVVFDVDGITLYSYNSIVNDGTLFLRLKSVEDDIVTFMVGETDEHISDSYSCGFTIYVLGGVSE